MFNYIQAIPEHQNTNHPIRLTKATCYPQQDTTVEIVTDNKAKGNDTEQLPKNGEGRTRRSYDTTDITGPAVVAM